MEDTFVLDQKKRKYVRSILVSHLLILFLYAIYAYLLENLFFIIFHVVNFLLLLWTYFIISKFKYNIPKVARFFIFYLLLLISFICLIDESGNSYYWFVSIPIGMLVLFDFKEIAITSLIIILLIAFVNYISMYINLHELSKGRAILHNSCKLMYIEI